MSQSALSDSFEYLVCYGYTTISGGSRGGRSGTVQGHKKKKRSYFGQNMLQNVSFEALDFKIFRGSKILVIW